MIGRAVPCKECGKEFHGGPWLLICSDACRRTRSSRREREKHLRDRDRRNARSRYRWHKRRDEINAQRRAERVALTPEEKQIERALKQIYYSRYRQKHLAKMKVRRAALKIEQRLAE